MRGRWNLRECEQSRVEARPATIVVNRAQADERMRSRNCARLISFVFITSACNEMAMLADTLRPKQRYQRHFQRQRGPSRHQPLPTAAYSALERCVHLEQGSINAFNKLEDRTSTISRTARVLHIPIPNAGIGSNLAVAERTLTGSI